MTSIDRTIYRRMKRNYATKSWLNPNIPTVVENDPEEQQKLVRYTVIIVNALMLQNVADLTCQIR